MAKEYTYKITLEEQETYIRRDPIDKEWIADTTIPADARKFKKQGWETVEETFYADGSFRSGIYKARLGAIKIGPAQKRELSDEEKESLRERMALARDKRTA